MAETRCSACLSPHVDAIEDALRSGTSVREVARQYRLGRGVLGRHLSHTGEPAVPAPSLIDARTALERSLALMEESMNALARAEESGRLPMILAALKGARASARQLRKGYEETSASSTDRTRLEVLHERAVAAYSRSIGKGQVEFSALEGLRRTVEDLRMAAGQVEGEVRFVLVGPGGERTEGPLIPASRVPPKYRRGGSIQLTFASPAVLDPDPFEADMANTNESGGGKHGKQNAG